MNAPLALPNNEATHSGANIATEKTIKSKTIITNNIFDKTLPNKLPKANKHKRTIGPYAPITEITLAYALKSTQFADSLSFENVNKASIAIVKMVKITLYNCFIPPLKHAYFNTYNPMLSNG